MKKISLILAAGLLGLAASRASAAVRPGDAAPGFSLRAVDGSTVSLDSFKGKVVVLEWNNPDCPFVRKHYDSGNLPGLQARSVADGVVWLVVNSSAPGKEGGDYSDEQIRSWLSSHHSAPTAYLRDPDGTVGHAYGARATPHLFVIDARGKVAYEGAIDSIASADPADIAKATNYVSEALLALKAGKPVAVSASRAYGCSVKY